MHGRGGSIDGSWGDFRLPPASRLQLIPNGNFLVGESLEEVVGTTSLRLKRSTGEMMPGICCCTCSENSIMGAYLQ